jgi:hypothetical protein
LSALSKPILKNKAGILICAKGLSNDKIIETGEIIEKMKNNNNL